MGGGVYSLGIQCENMTALLKLFICLMTVIIANCIVYKCGSANQAATQFAIDSEGAKSKPSKRSAIVGCAACTALIAATALGATRFIPAASVVGGYPDQDQESAECLGILESVVKS